MTSGPGPVCRLPYLPLDGAVPALPGNLYALSKQAGEEMLQYAERVAGLSCVAVRFPWLVPESVATLRQRKSVRDAPDTAARINEAFSALCLSDAAELVERILASDLPGFRRYLPASHRPLTTRPLDELLGGIYAGIPLRVPKGSFGSLIDTSSITADTGWTPDA